MRARLALLCLTALFVAAASSAAGTAARPSKAKANKDPSGDPTHFFATRQGLLRVYQERNADAKNAATTGSATDSADATAGASCEVIESTPKDGTTAARTRESCTMISGRKPKSAAQLTYELRDAGIYMVQSKAEGPADPVALDRLMLPAPLKKGKSWVETRGTTKLFRTVKSAGKACKTTNSKFGDCLVISVIEKEGKKTRRKYAEIYAAGVGLVEDAQWELIDVKGL